METDVHCFHSLSRLNSSIFRPDFLKCKHRINLDLYRAELSSFDSSKLRLPGYTPSELSLKGVKVMLHFAII